jgi:2-dehydro-3-deoxyphosphogluconate aldolase / (4S)-4-hydroxy-2-oxoglutarate aldolase
MSGIAELLGRDRVVPVVKVGAVADAVPLAGAIRAGGLGSIEVTLRTPAALEAIAEIAAAFPDLAVGAGTVTEPEQVAAAVAAGARFIVTPGVTVDLWAALEECGLPFICGCATPSEVMFLQGYGVAEAKLFPAEASGGRELLRALAGPFPTMRFCPTGGIGVGLVGPYLGEPNVFAVGCSWVGERAAARDWDGVRAAAARAAEFGVGAPLSPRR